MTSEELVVSMLRDSDAGDLDAFRARLAPDCDWRNPMLRATGPDDVIAGIAGYRAAFPDYRHELSLVVSAGDTVAIEGEWTGSNTGPLATPEGELPPTGRAVRVPFAAVARTQGERVASVHVYLDPLGFMAQLGLAPEPAAA